MKKSELGAKSTIKIGDILLEGYKTNDGDWVMSINNAANAVSKSHSSIRSFIKTNWLRERLGYEPKLKIKKTKYNNIHVIPFNIFLLYLRRQEELGNVQAKFIVDCLLAKNLESNFLDAFGKPSYDIRIMKESYIDYKPKSSLYVFTEISTDITKIGITSNVSERHKKLELQSGRCLDIAYVSKKMSYNVAKCLEADLFSKFSEYRLNGEWFKINADVVLKEI